MAGFFPVKKGETVTEAFNTIFEEGRKAQYLWTDKPQLFEEILYILL